MSTEESKIQSPISPPTSTPAKLSPAPSEPFPLYCAICAAPCNFPRIRLPNSEKMDTSFLLQSDTITSSPSPSPSLSWLNKWHILRVSDGLIEVSITSSVLPPDPNAQPEPKREIRIHDYCLHATLSTIRKSFFNNGTSHEEAMLIGWSLPKWTGFGPWVVESGSGVGVGVGMGSGQSGYWKGTVSQRERWNGEVGSHLLPMDLVSPVEIGSPTPCLTLCKAAKKGFSPLESLPSTILLEIVQNLLDHPNTTNTESKIVPASLIPLTKLQDFSSLLGTCPSLRYLDLPSTSWRRITTDLVKHFKLKLLYRWRANPTGVGSAAQLWIALDQNFVEPVARAFAGVSIDHRQSSVIEQNSEKPDDVRSESTGYGARDVYQWWMYDERWRSRWRVWHCVVYGCAEARDADWW